MVSLLERKTPHYSQVTFRHLGLQRSPEHGCGLLRVLPSDPLLPGGGSGQHGRHSVRPEGACPQHGHGITEPASELKWMDVFLSEPLAGVHFAYDADHPGDAPHKPGEENQDVWSG